MTIKARYNEFHDINDKISKVKQLTEELEHTVKAIAESHGIDTNERRIHRGGYPISSMSRNLS